MEPFNYWKNRWSGGKTEWHKTKVYSYLTEYNSKLDFTPPKRVLIPMCGKCLELLWFYEKDFEVVGIEIVEQPVQEFFKEHNVSHTVKELPWAKLYESDDNRIKIFVCSIYDINVEELGNFDVVWDRAALGAVEIADRQRYAKLMQSLCKKDFQYLLVTFQYDGTECNGGPPRCIPHELTKELYGDWCNIEHVTTTDISEPRYAINFGVHEMLQSFQILTPKK